MTSITDRIERCIGRACGRVLPRNAIQILARTFSVRRKKLIKATIRYYENVGADDEIKAILSYLSRTVILQYPYAWTENVRDHDVKKEYLPYALLYGKKCYYPKNMKKWEVVKNVTFVNDVEQHEMSPHLYLTEGFDVGNDDIVVDCGAADGNFGLSIVDRVKKLYIFEPEEQWQEPLRRTFGPWSDKVEIIQKYVSDVETNDTVTIDSFFAGKEGPTFLKLDVEGYERNVLSGAAGVLHSSVKKAIVCTYHLVDDHKVLSDVMLSNGFSVNTSKGYMLTDFDGKEPYLRRVLIRCTKITQDV